MEKKTNNTRRKWNKRVYTDRKRHQSIQELVYRNSLLHQQICFDFPFVIYFVFL